MIALDKVVDSVALDAEMQSVADAIRAKTGDSDPLAWPDGFAAAIAALSAGGSGGSDGLAYDMGEFVLDADCKFDSNGIQHYLGSAPDFIVVWSDDFAAMDIPTDYHDNVGYIFVRGMTLLPQRLTSAISSTDGLSISLTRTKSDTVNRVIVSIPTSNSYVVGAMEISDTVIPVATLGSGNMWRAGVTYRYFVSKAWWNVGGASDAE